MNAQLPKVRNNLLEEMNPEWDCIVSKTRAFKKFSWKQKKKSKEIFLLQQNMEDTRKNQISIYPRTMNILT